MKMIAISDTHGQHRELDIPDGDVIIHSGDVSGMGIKAEIESFIDWFGSLPHKYKIFIAGNHDFYFEHKDAEKIIPKNIIYLNDTSVNIEGINIHGSPIQPWFYDWAFNRERGREIKKHWDLIPKNTDILITHGPPRYVLDMTRNGDCPGCDDLLAKVIEIGPKYHIFGHIHEGYGQVSNQKTNFINASVLNENYFLINKPIVFEYV